MIRTRKCRRCEGWYKTYFKKSKICLDCWKPERQVKHYEKILTRQYDQKVK